MQPKLHAFLVLHKCRSYTSNEKSETISHNANN